MVQVNDIYGKSCIYDNEQLELKQLDSTQGPVLTHLCKKSIKEYLQLQKSERTCTLI